MEKTLRDHSPRRPERRLDHARAEAGPDAAHGLDPAQAAILLPNHLLQNGEIIVLLLKPSPWFVLLGCLRSLGVIALLTLAVLCVAPDGAGGIHRRDIIFLATGLAGARVFWQFLEWLSHVYVLTDRRIVRVRGVVRVQVFEAGLKQIQHTSTHFSFRERLFGLGTIGFATAGAGGTIEAYWWMVANPLEVHEIVVQTLGRYR